MPKRSVLPVAALVGLTVAAPALASTNAAKFDLGFSTKAPSKATSLSVDVVFANAGGSSVPAALNRFSLVLPKGAKFDARGAAQCTATDKELADKGSAACPANTVVGKGKASASLPSGGNPINSTVKIYNLSLVKPVKDKSVGDLLFVFQIGGKDAASFAARGRGNKLVSQKLTGKLPGGVVVTSLKGKIDKRSKGGRSLLTTPKRCPKSHKWTIGGVFKFADGTHRPTTTTPCKS